LALLNCGDGTAIADYAGWSCRGRLVAWLKDQIDRRFVRSFQISDAPDRTPSED
jgi:hypothetical protein